MLLFQFLAGESEDTEVEAENEPRAEDESGKDTAVVPAGAGDEENKEKEELCEDKALVPAAEGGEEEQPHEEDEEEDEWKGWDETQEEGGITTNRHVLHVHSFTSIM